MSRSQTDSIEIRPELNYFFGLDDDIESKDKKFFILVIYDISENKRRNKMVKILSSYGFRVQKSAFEAMIRPEKYNKLLKEIKNIPDKTDSIRVYKIQGKGTVEVFGEPYSIIDEETIII